MTKQLTKNVGSKLVGVSLQFKSSFWAEINTLIMENYLDTLYVLDVNLRLSQVPIPSDLHTW